MITEEAQQRLEALRDCFLAENAKLNLSAFRTPETCWTGNILDAVAALEVNSFRALTTHNAQLTTPLRILDLGTGGGFPLLALALCLPQCRFVGIDSVQKKIAAVQRIIDVMRISNVTLLCGRAEELGRNALYREQYDVVTCRAVAELNVLIELSVPFLKTGGTLLCWKSLHCEQELKDSLLARADLSCQMRDPHVYDLGPHWGKRQILVFQKRAKTSDKYPRAVGEPKKRPLR